MPSGYYMLSERASMRFFFSVYSDTARQFITFRSRGGFGFLNSMLQALAKESWVLYFLDALILGSTKHRTCFGFSYGNMKASRQNWTMQRVVRKMKGRHTEIKNSNTNLVVMTAARLGHSVLGVSRLRTVEIEPRKPVWGEVQEDTSRSELEGRWEWQKGSCVLETAKS